MLMYLQCLLLRIFYIILFNIILNSKNRMIVDNILYKLFTTNSYSFMHYRIHNIVSFFFINFCYLYSHNIDNIKDYFIFLFISTYTEKCYFNIFSLNITLI